MDTKYIEQFKAVCKMKWAELFAFFSAILWIGTALYFAIAQTPISYDHSNDFIEPNVIKSGENFRVSRSFTASRDTHIFITRTVSQGDCNKNCEIIDISQGYSFVEKGKYYHRWREHRMPSRVTPGKWQFLVTVQWEDKLGAMHSIKLKPLEIEVIK